MFSFRFGKKQSNQSAPGGSTTSAPAQCIDTAPVCEKSTAVDAADLLHMQSAGGGNAAALACMEQQQEETGGIQLQLGPDSDEQEGGIPFLGRSLFEEVFGYEESSVRSQLQGGTPTSEELASDPGWTELPQAFTGSHDNGEGSPERKFVHTSGREAIVDGSTGEVINDPEIGGTFNFINPRGPSLALLTNPLERARFIAQNIGHGIVDYAPHVIPQVEQALSGNEKQ